MRFWGAKSGEREGKGQRCLSLLCLLTFAAVLLQLWLVAEHISGNALR